MVKHSDVAVHTDFNAMLVWLSADVLLDFKNKKEVLERAASNESEFFWLVRERLSPGERRIGSGFSVEQLKFVVHNFHINWPSMERPSLGTRGRRNHWDAAEFIESAIYALAGIARAEATEALTDLCRAETSTYIRALRHALSLQLRVRRDSEYVAPQIEQLKSVVSDGLPESTDDMRAYFGDRLSDAQQRIRGGNTDMWEAYWEGNRPKSENYCRNRLIDHISSSLPESIRFEPEMQMPAQKRADIAAIRNSIGLPVEIKGQWHPEVWSAPIEQLDAKYTHDWHAEGRGVYIVMWFGKITGKNLPKHPDGLATPESSADLRQMLLERLPEARRSQIDVYVIDVTPPMKA